MISDQTILVKKTNSPDSATVSTKKAPESRGRASQASNRPFPIVGIGASAGGIQAITKFLQHLNPELGMAFVLVMHLSPNHKSALAEIMRSKTKMTVQTVKDGMKVVPNNLYVIPPGTFMSIVKGHLKLAPREITSIGNFAVDYLFTALASAYKNNAIGIILSGTATDGTLGLKAIKAEGGITFAQNDTAEFDGMPQHAYQAGHVDFLLSPEEIAKELARLVKVPYTILPSDDIEKSDSKPPSEHVAELKKILAIVKTKTGVDFYHHYKQASIYRRVMRRMALMKAETLHNYYSLLLTSPREVDALYDDFLINVTSFFRDPDFFAALTKKVFPAITKKLSDVEPIRIWVAGCATGEEAYSIAICLLEFLETNRLNIQVQIFASDLDATAIEKARMGIYPISALQGVGQNLLKKYFTRVDSNFQILKSVREVCVFSQQNLLKDPPFSRMHLISCQNVLIYLESGPQKKVLQTFHYSLKPAGFLFLGKSESVNSEEDLFQPLDKRIRLFSRKATSAPHLDFTVHKTGIALGKGGHGEHTLDADPEKAMSKLVLSSFVLPSVVVNKNMMITQFFGSTSQYLQPVTGKASFNILKMIREELVIDLGRLLQQARKTEARVSMEAIRVYDDSVPRDISIEVIPKRTSEEVLFLVVFRDTPVPQLNKRLKPAARSDQKDKRILKLEQELVHSRGLIRNTNEEYATTYEELQANNEEILSSNEELQSVNEELETSKEELQSAVEELTTTNDELRKRNGELSESQGELKMVNEQLEQFAFISSHDLQEPLRKILTFTNLLSNPEANLNSFSKNYSNKISASASRLSSLLKDLLSFSVLINKEHKFELVDLNETLKNVLTGLDVDIKKTGAVINLSDLPSIPAEPIQMEQLFRNLVSNSLKFSKENPVIDITSELASNDDASICPELHPDIKYVSIQVKDNGIGFDEKYTEKIFSLFQRLNEKSGVDGTGIGLAICKKVVQNHGGCIVANGKKGVGATFTVFLPTKNPSHFLPVG